MQEITIQDIKNLYRKAPRFSSGGTHEAFIVKIYYSEYNYNIGVNYWTKEEADKRVRMMDGFKCTIIEPLYSL